MSPQIALLSERAVIAVTGADAAAFLHGLVTADTAHLEPGQAAYGALLTPQGKILFDFFAVRQADGFLIDCSAAQVEALAQRLTMYKLRRQVEIGRRDDLAVWAWWGGKAPDAAVAFLDPRLADAGYRIIAPTGAVEATATPEDYAAHRIALGLADTDGDIGSGETFAHEANLDQLGGVSFTKGCYVGQEVVSRMQHRGTARARIVPVEGEGLTTGAEIRAGDKAIGSVLSVAGGRALARVRLDRAAAASDPLMANGHAVSILRPDWAKYTTPGGEE